MTAPRPADLVAGLRSEPKRSAVLLDVDGTLAPITRHASSTEVPPGVRSLLAEISLRFGLVACVSGRRAAEARRIVGVGSLHYVGNHGAEILRRGSPAAETTPAVGEWEERVRGTARRLLDEHPGAERAGIWLEDKGPIQGLHWRGAADQEAAEATVVAIGEAAEAAGLRLHRGRKVLELRPPVDFDKGAAVEWLLRGDDAAPAAGAPPRFAAALYAGDDRTDVDAFRGLRNLRDEGVIGEAVCVGVASDETPDEVAASADLVVDGTGGVRSLLEGLLSP